MKHIKLKHSEFETNYTCPKCNTKCKEVTTIISHFKTHHKEVISPQIAVGFGSTQENVTISVSAPKINTKSTPTVKCICGSVFTSGICSFNEHVRLHHDSTDYSKFKVFECTVKKRKIDQTFDEVHTKKSRDSFNPNDAETPEKISIVGPVTNNPSTDAMDTDSLNAWTHTNDSENYVVSSMEISSNETGNYLIKLSLSASRPNELANLNYSSRIDFKCRVIANDLSTDALGKVKYLPSGTLAKASQNNILDGLFKSIQPFKIPKIPKLKSNL